MSYLAGARLRSTVVFVPEVGNTTLGSVSARLIDGSGGMSVLVVSQDSTDHYHADFDVPDDSPPGPWCVRWESQSPKIVVETTFAVAVSGVLNP